MTGIDFKMDSGMVPQTWIIDGLKMYQISDQFIKIRMNTMENWRVELTAGGQTRAAVKIQKKSIFPEDSLSPWLFLLVMMPLNYVRRICVEWGDTNLFNH